MKSLFSKLILLAISTAIPLAAAEYYLRWDIDNVAESEIPPENMVSYDSKLGWKLVPNWRGEHSHYDFKTSYNVNRQGFRTKPFLKSPVLDKNRILLIGDSFTFGTGVKDDQTFSHVLDVELDDEVLNLGVPGYSTDQQLILLRDFLKEYSADTVIIMTYLGNDLFDNTLDYPLQADNAKPYFAFTRNKLELRNSPAPILKKTNKQTLSNYVFQELGLESPTGLVGSRLIERLSVLFPNETEYESLRPVSNAFESEITLYKELIKELVKTNKENNIQTFVGLIPGKSFYFSKKSLSAKTQNFLANRIRESLKDVIDIERNLIDLRGSLESSSRPPYFENEGHLNAGGHKLAAERIRLALKKY